jgi:hypothetical protein
MMLKVDFIEIGFLPKFHQNQIFPIEIHLPIVFLPKALLLKPNFITNLD